MKKYIFKFSKKKEVSQFLSTVRSTAIYLKLLPSSLKKNPNNVSIVICMKMMFGNVSFVEKALAANVVEKNTILG